MDFQYWHRNHYQIGVGSLVSAHVGVGRGGNRPASEKSLTEKPSNATKPTYKKLKFLSSPGAQKSKNKGKLIAKQNLMCNLSRSGTAGHPLIAINKTNTITRKYAPLGPGIP